MASKKVYLKLSGFATPTVLKLGDTETEHLSSRIQNSADLLPIALKKKQNWRV